MGYHRAGFAEITGIDIEEQPHYPFRFIQGDAVEYLAKYGTEYDFIHASPPCQAFTDLHYMWNAKEHPNLIDPIRDLLNQIGKPYVIENVEGAPIQNPVILCGTMFGLGTGDAELWRHRLFETNWGLTFTPLCQHRAKRRVIGVYGGHGRDRRRVITVTGHSGGKSLRSGTQQFTVEQRKEAMGIDWMNGEELSQAVPPTYTEWIGLRYEELLATSLPQVPVDINMKSKSTVDL